jgi:hypothetical protein
MQCRLTPPRPVVAVEPCFAFVPPLDPETIAIDPADSDHVWVGHASGELWRSLNATAADPAWTRIDAQGAQAVNAPRYCHQVAISHHNSDLLIADFGGFTTGNVAQHRP